MKTSLLLAIGLAAASVAAADTHIGIGFNFVAPAPVVVHRAPPARIVERVTVSPGPGYVWVPGHYTRGGDRWIWMTGMWVVPPRPDAVWIDAQWIPHAHQWVEAHWEVRSAPVVVATPPPPVTVVEPTPAEVVVTEPPPPAVVEVRTVAPGPDFIWIDGYWGWEHGRRFWVGGHWEHPPYGHRVWVAPRWEHRHEGYVYIRGYWR